MNLRKFMFAIIMATAGALSLFGQNQKVTINVKQVPVQQVLEQIKQDSGVEIVYKDDSIDLRRRVNVNSKSQPLKNVLQQLFKGTDVVYTFQDNVIILSVRPKSKNVLIKSTPRKVSGTVTDKSGEPLIGATVREKGTNNVAVTDIEGNYEITVDSSSPVLTCTYVGYTPANKSVKGEKVADIVLSENESLLDDVVVVGYGNMKKRDLTGSVASVKLDDSFAGTAQSASLALIGSVPGLQVTQNSAKPGSGANYIMRGFSSPNADNRPLIIIDGFPVSPINDSNISVGIYDNGGSDNMLGSLNPNDIASIEVLKDASSTAIYGARAGHGVIIVTTKKGKQGKAKVTYSGSVSVQTISKKYEMLNAEDFRSESNRRAYYEYLEKNKLPPYGDTDPLFVPDFVPRFDLSSPLGESYDWFGAITQTGVQTQHNLSVSGGTDNLRYLVSGNYFYQDGVVKGNDFSRFNLRVNVDQKFNRHFSGGLNLTLSRSDTRETPASAKGASQMNPLLPFYDEDGNYSINPEYPQNNPLSELEVDNLARRDRAMAMAYVEYKPIEELTIKGNVGFDRSNHKRKVYLPKNTFDGSKENGRADIAEYDQNDYLAELTASYSNTFKDIHRLDAVAGASYQKFTREGFTAGNSDFLTDALKYNAINMGQYVKPWVTSTGGNDEMASVFARVNYSLKSRYLLTATLRADGSSYFAKGHQWGLFPSVAFAWRFTDEEFMDKLGIGSWWSNGKIRVSWGQTGNSSIGYHTLSYYNDRDDWGNRFTHAFGGKEYLGLRMTQLGNKNLTWETTSDWNFGLDLGFLNNRINLTVDYFIRDIKDLLNWRPLPMLQEVGQIVDNIGSTRTHGLELALNTVNIRTPEFTWTTDLTYSFSRSRWKERADTWFGNAYDKYNDYTSSFKGYYIADGLVQPGEEVPHMPGAIPGQVKLKDIRGYVYNEDGSYKTDEHGLPILSNEPDGKLDDADRINLGQSGPSFIMGMNNSIRWKNFDFNIYFYGRFRELKGGCYKDFMLDKADQILFGINMPVSMKDMWSVDNPTGWRPGFAQGVNSTGVHNTTYYVKRVNMVRCRNITLGYTIPTGNRLNKLRVYADVNNPFVISNYDGIDPETGDDYPNVISFNLGVEITF